LALRFPGALKHSARAAHHRLGNSDELAIFPGLLFVSLLRRHALDLLHAPPGGS
jgi:hypothetical protein